ncbi:hypothetical protein B0T11DRAFT_299156 [Plectosphaerella cucumerina]|uniref:Uncharacterized protein n=1 Tax=Plectosphaerella cucumerina TaxID=40658 RepID=A0A8K0TED8_9PEZI|nr:hypothetical protein B0T11DRAFT_299156 [Plectosphaerella cucumerina]
MRPSAILLLAVSSLAAAAAVASPAYCAKPPYKAVLVLASYPPAQSFCSARYPIATSTVTVTTTVPAPARRVARAPVTPAPLVKNAVACTGNCAAWSSLSKIGGSLVKSACGCIQTTPTKTVTVTSTQPPLDPCAGYNAPTFAQNLPAGCDPLVDGSDAYYNYVVAAQRALDGITVFNEVPDDSTFKICDFALQCARATKGSESFAVIHALSRTPGGGRWKCAGTGLITQTTNDCTIGETAFVRIGGGDLCSELAFCVAHVQMIFEVLSRHEGGTLHHRRHRSRFVRDPDRPIFAPRYYNIVKHHAPINIIRLRHIASKINNDRERVHRPRVVSLLKQVGPDDSSCFPASTRHVEGAGEWPLAVRRAPVSKIRQWFDASVLQNDSHFAECLQFMSELRRKCRLAAPTETYRLILQLRECCRLIRCYSQNIDQLESKVVSDEDCEKIIKEVEHCQQAKLHYDSATMKPVHDILRDPVHPRPANISQMMHVGDDPGHAAVVFFIRAR